MSQTQFDFLMMFFTLFGIVFLALLAGFLIAHSGGMGGMGGGGGKAQGQAAGKSGGAQKGAQGRSKPSSGASTPTQRSAGSNGYSGSACGSACGSAGGYAGNYPAPQPSYITPPTDPYWPDPHAVPAIAEPHYVLLPGLSQMLMIAGPDAGGRMHLLDQMGLDVTAGLLGQGIDVDRLLADAPQLYISGSTDEDGRTLDYMPAGYLTGDEQSFIPSGLLTDGESYYLNTEFAYGGQLGDMYGAEPLAVLDGNGYADLAGFDPELVDGDWQYLGEMAQLEDHGGESGYSEGFDEGESGES